MITHQFTGLSVGQVSELIELFRENCHHWDKVRGYASVSFEEFDTEEDFQMWHQHFEFESD